MPRVSKQLTHGHTVSSKSMIRMQTGLLYNQVHSTTLYLEKEIATCSSILAWRIPWTELPGRLHSMGSQELNMN